MDHIWHVRNPDGASTGLEVANARIAATEHVLAHALPERVDVEVRTLDGDVVASGRALSGEESSPIARLRIDGDRVVRSNIWPGSEDVGLTVLLPGGEAGVLCSWWNAPDQSEWRWRVEFYNHA